MKFKHKRLVLTAALALSPLRASSPEEDSLRTLKMIIFSELEGKGKVLILKDKEASDSLMRLQKPPESEGFNRLIGDSSVTMEVKTREEFRNYWRQIEARHGFKELRAQYGAQDIDRRGFRNCSFSIPR